MTSTATSSRSARPPAPEPAVELGATRRAVMLHADDFGFSEGINAGIIRGFTDGLLTSTSLLANGPACGSALGAWHDLQARAAAGALPSHAARVRLGDSRLGFDLGVHLNLTQGRPLTGAAYPRRLLAADGNFPGVFALTPRLAAFGRQLRTAIRDELCAQIEVVLERGIAPTHLNAHQYIEMLPAVAVVIPELLDRYRLRVVRVAWEHALTRTALVGSRQPAAWALAQIKRQFAFPFLVRMNRLGALHAGNYFGTAHAGRITLPILSEFLRAARETTVEIGLHPGCAPSDERHPDGWGDPLATGRVRELAMLASPNLVETLAASHVRLGRLQELTPAVRRAVAA